MPRRDIAPNRRVFEKYERAGDEWYFSCKFTLAEFIRDNSKDEWTWNELKQDFIPRLKELGVGETYVYYGGAGGDDRFTRVK